FYPPIDGKNIGGGHERGRKKEGEQAKKVIVIVCRVHPPSVVSDWPIRYFPVWLSCCWCSSCNDLEVKAEVHRGHLLQSPPIYPLF
ncbi:hypothetical protein LOAG_04484, partial [Loa loa]